jgi:hypothetical protein
VGTSNEINQVIHLITMIYELVKREPLAITLELSSYQKSLTAGALD